MPILLINLVDVRVVGEFPTTSLADVYAKAFRWEYAVITSLEDVTRILMPSEIYDLVRHVKGVKGLPPHKRLWNSWCRDNWGSMPEAALEKRQCSTPIFQRVLNRSVSRILYRLLTIAPVDLLAFSKAFNITYPQSLQWLNAFKENFHRYGIICWIRKNEEGFYELLHTKEYDYRNSPPSKRASRQVPSHPRSQL